jgi:hypothetical protein
MKKSSERKQREDIKYYNTLKQYNESGAQIYTSNEERKKKERKKLHNHSEVSQVVGPTISNTFIASLDCKSLFPFLSLLCRETCLRENFPKIFKLFNL